MPTWNKSLSKIFDLQMFCAKPLILPNLFDVDRKEAIAEGVFSIDFEQVCDFLVLNK